MEIAGRHHADEHIKELQSQLTKRDEQLVALKNIMEKQQETIAVMDSLLLREGINYDFNKTDEIHNALKLQQLKSEG